MTNWTPALEAGKPRYLAIADAISADLASGKLKAGDRLPPQRNLAWKLGVTIGTVTRAYQEASKRGLLSGEVGRGSYLRQAAPSPAAMPGVVHGSEPGVLNLQISSPPRVHLAADLDAAFAGIIRDPTWPELLEYGRIAGAPQHLAAASRWLSLSQVEAPPERIVLSAGAQAALITLLSTLSSPGDGLIIEPLTYPTMRPIAQHFGMPLRPMEADAGGILPESLERLAQQGAGKIVYIVPTLHNPTSVTLSAERRRAIADIAHRYGLTIIEDDVFRLLADDVSPPIQSWAPEHTYYITSMSKTLAPGFRLAFTLPPKPEATEAMNRQQLITGGKANNISAEIVRRWIDTGTGERVLAAIRAELAERREIALDALSGCEAACAPGSMFVWASLPPQWSPAEFSAAAQAIGIKVTPGNAFAMDPAVPHQTFRACLGPPSSRDTLREGFERLNTLIAARGAEDHFTQA